MFRPKLTPLAASLPQSVPFVGPEAIERRVGRPFLARIGANESEFGPAPQAIAAMTAAAEDVWHYGDPECYDLRCAVATHLGIKADEVVMGEGVDGLLGLAVRLYAADGATVVTSVGGYPTFNYHLTGFGSRIVSVPYRNDHEDIEALAAAAQRENAAMVYLANPDNPMGTWWSADAVSEFVAAVPETCLIILDEAYGEFAPPGTLPTIDTSRPNLLRMRTFSKAYGMAGIRCGYAFGDQKTIAPFDGVRNHFGVNSLAQRAAIAALDAQDHLESVVALTAAARNRIARIAADAGFVAVPSATNFVAIDCGRDAAYAGSILNGLAERGVFIRKPMAPGLDRCIRISVGRDETLDLLARALPETLAALG